VETLDRMLATMRHAFGATGRGRSRWVDVDGIGALVTPEVPDRSIVNCVVYERGSDIEAAYDRLEHEFAEVNAWTVWVPDSDRETARFLESRGHSLDGTPSMMALELSKLQVPSQLPDWKPATVEELARINEAAYPWQDGSLERAILESAFDDEQFRLYMAEDASVLGIDSCRGDAGVFWVATLPEARGRGLSGGLLAAALLDARDSGCDISTLQATAMGEPVYARLGYERLGAIEMWERRKA
jgi:GNAT superfamily N-acetyltransferase